MTRYVVSAGQTSSGTVLGDGDVQQVHGTAVDTTVHGGGVVEVHNTGTSIDTVVSSGGLETDIIGTASGTVVSSGGRLNVYGNAVNTVLRGGTENLRFGTASGTVVSSGGIEVVVKYGTAVGSPPEYGYGSVVVGGVESGTAIGTVVSSGGQQVVSGGIASGTVVSRGGRQSVSDGGTAYGTVVSLGGEQSVNGGGTASGTVVRDGVEQVLSGGTASGTKLVFVAQAVVHSGGVAVNLVADTPSGDVVNDGTLAFTGSGAFREPGFIRGSGTLVVSGPDTTVVLDPLTDLPGNYNTYAGGTRIDAGVLDLAAPRAAGTGPITFIHDQGGATGTLRIEPGAAPANTISGFLPGATIDLADVGSLFPTTFTDNVLTLIDRYSGEQVAALRFDPKQSFEGYAIRVVPDGHGGTDLTVVPASPSTATGA